MKTLLHQVRLFFVALQFFTRLPIPGWVGFAPEWLSASARYFPLVGQFIGALLAGFVGLSLHVLPPLIVIWLSTALGLLLTGAFHEDGFADVCDGFGGAHEPIRVLEIMRDSRIGAYGALGLLMILGTKISTLAGLSPAQLPGVLLLAHGSSRACACALIWRLDYVREEGKAKPLARHLSGSDYAWAVATLLPGSALTFYALSLSWQSCAVALALAIAVTLYAARYFVRRIGGYTGDCLGATQQLAEVTFYLGWLLASRVCA